MEKNISKHNSIHVLKKKGLSINTSCSKAPMCSLSGFKQRKENTNDVSKGISCANQYREEPAPFLKQLHLILINYQLKPTITECGAWAVLVLSFTAGILAADIRPPQPDHVPP